MRVVRSGGAARRREIRLRPRSPASTKAKTKRLQLSILNANFRKEEKHYYIRWCETSHCRERTCLTSANSSRPIWLSTRRVQGEASSAHGDGKGATRSSTNIYTNQQNKQRECIAGKQLRDHIRNLNFLINGSDEIGIVDRKKKFFGIARKGKARKSSAFRDKYKLTIANAI